MPLTPEDVRNKQFTTVRLREGYDEDEVDAFLDEVEAELTRLLRENEDLRAKLAAATRAAAQNQQNMRKPPEPPQDQQQHQQGPPQHQQGPPQQGGMPQQGMRGPGAPVPAGISGPPQQQMGGPMGGPPQLPSGAPQLPAGPGGQGGPQGPGPMGQGPGPMGQGPGPMQGQMGPGPMGGPMGGPQGHGGPGGMPGQGGPGGDSAARVLSLAQQTADQAIAEARSEANKIVGEARSRAEGLERDARAKADALERDAQEKHRVAMGSLESARATLERKVEDLRGFEREYPHAAEVLPGVAAAPAGDPGGRLARPAAYARHGFPAAVPGALDGTGRRQRAVLRRQPVDGQRSEPVRSVLRRPAADVAGDDPADGTGAAPGAVADGAGAFADARVPDRRGRQLICSTA
ncbi:DivIVA domain-containing protein [Streptomyces ambofaciens]